MYKVQNLNSKMKLAVEYLISHPYYKTEDVVNELGISAMTLMNWQHSPVFLDYYDERLREEWKDSIRKAQRRMEDLSAQGNYNATKYILDAGGFAPTNKLEANVTSQIIKIGIDDE